MPTICVRLTVGTTALYTWIDSGTRFHHAHPSDREACWADVSVCDDTLRERWEIPSARKLASLYIHVSTTPTRGALCHYGCSVWVARLLYGEEWEFEDLARTVWWWVEYEEWL